MNDVGGNKSLAISASAFLIGAIFFGTGFLLAALRVNDVDDDLLHQGVLTHRSGESRVAFAAAQYLTYPQHQARTSEWIEAKTELCRSLLSHASFEASTPQDSLLRLLGEDPLLVGPRMIETDSVFRTHVDEIGDIYEDLLAAETIHEKSVAIAGIEARIPRFLSVLYDRSIVLEQLVATAHAQLRANRERTQRRLAFLLVGQIGAFLAAALLTVLVFQSQLSHVKELRGLIPICSYCKKVRDDAGFWKNVEAYISARTDCSFSHGLCPACLKEHYPEVDASDID